MREPPNGACPHQSDWFANGTPMRSVNLSSDVLARTFCHRFGPRDALLILKWMHGGGKDDKVLPVCA